MPKKPKFTREALLIEACAVAEEQGIDEVSSRSLAKRLNCSIQPIYTHFPTMAELRQETFRYACRQFSKELLSCRPDQDPFSWIWNRVVDLARNRSNLFKLIFLSEGYTSRSLPEAMQEILSSQKLTARVMELYDLTEEGCQDVIIRSNLFLLGIGTMICSRHLDFSDEELEAIRKKTVSDLVQGAKSRR